MSAIDKEAASAKKPSADKAETTEADKEAASEEKKRAGRAPTFKVAAGRALTSRRGILVAGTELDAARDGISDMDALVKIGAVVRS